MVQVPDLEQLEPNDLPSCPWCLSEECDIDRQQSTSGRCRECGSRLPLQAEWYWENKKVRKHTVKTPDGFKIFTHSHYVDVTRKSSQESTIAQEQEQEETEANSALDW